MVAKTGYGWRGVMFFSACRSEQKFIRCLVPGNRQNKAITEKYASLVFFARENQLCFYSPGNSRNQYGVLIKNQQSPVSSYSVKFIDCELDEDAFNSVPQLIAREQLSCFTHQNGGVAVQSASYRQHIDTSAVPAVSFHQMSGINSLLFSHPSRSRHVREAVCYAGDMIVALEYRWGLELRILPNVMEEVSTLYGELDPLPRAAMDTYFQHSQRFS